jgi:hypothetical protein
MLRKKELLAKLIKFTKWQLVSLKMVLGGCRLSEKSCHCVNLLSFATSSFFSQLETNHVTQLIDWESCKKDWHFPSMFINFLKGILCTFIQNLLLILNYKEPRLLRFAKNEILPSIQNVLWNGLANLEKSSSSGTFQCLKKHGRLLHSERNSILRDEATLNKINVKCPALLMAG